MPVITSQQIADYFREFAETEVTFSKDVARAIGLNPSGVHLQCMGGQWPCAIYGSSMTSARIITKLRPSLNESLRKTGNVVSLRYDMIDPENDRSIAFFVKARTTSFSQFGRGGADLCVAHLEFAQRPPDDLIRILGRLLEAKRNATRRKEWRLPMSSAIVKALGIVPNGVLLRRNGSRYPALLRDVSFSGCKAVVPVAAEAFAGDEIGVVIPFQEPNESVDLAAEIRHADTVEGHEFVGVFGIHFKEERVPVAFKLRINAALRSRRDGST